MFTVYQDLGRFHLSERIIPARIRSMTGRYCSHRCLSINISGGVPRQGLDGRGVPHPRSGRGVPHPRSGWGVPHLRSGQGVVPHPRSGWGRGIPPDLRWGTPPDLGWGTPLDLGWGTPQEHGTEYPPDLRWGTLPRQISITSTCYTVGGMPLAFTQEDFLVRFCFCTKNEK